MIYNHIPLIRLAIPFAIGIIFSHNIESIFSWKVQLLCCCILLLSVIVLHIKPTYKLRGVFGVMSTLIMILLGSSIHLEYNRYDVDINPSSTTNWIGEVEELDIKNNGRENAIVRIDMINSKRLANQFKIIARFKAENKVKVGDKVISRSHLYPFKKPHFESQFDYSAFMKNRQILFTTYPGKMMVVGHSKSIYYYANMIRYKARKIFKDQEIKPENFTILNALILGDKSLLESETRSNFAKAGVMHILAVSGLHVGIIYLILNMCFKRVKRYRLGRIFKAVVSLLCIWLFALTSGLSPSVQRAAFMFSVVIVGESLGRPSHALNSIFGSALILLLINPNLIFEVGFQLSYSAVIAIVTVFSFMRKVCFVSNKILRYIIELSIISIIAQLATMPLAMYYFHQFPNYFLLFNILVIPLTFLIVSGAVLTLTLSFIPYLNDLLAQTLDFLLSALQKIVNQVGNIEHANTADIYLDKLELVLIALTSIFLLSYLGGYFKKGIHLSLICVLFILFYNNINLKKNQLKFNTACIGNEEYLIIENSRQAVVKSISNPSEFTLVQIKEHLKSQGKKHIFIHP